MRKTLLYWSAWENPAYNPEKARSYRQDYQNHDAFGRTWNQRGKDTRDTDPKRKERNRHDVARHRFIAKRNLKELLIDAGASPEAARRFLKPLSFDELDRLANFLTSRDESTPIAPGVLLKFLRSPAPPPHEAHASNLQENVTGLDAIPLSP